MSFSELSQEVWSGLAATAIMFLIYFFAAFSTHKLSKRCINPAAGA
jgi:hypothetical protein